MSGSIDDLDSMLPDRVRVLGFDWRITSPNSELQGRERYGETHYIGFEIHVDDSQPVQRQRETLLHELIHAGCEQFLIGDNEVSEAQLRVIAHTMFQVLSDNPAVLTFIFGGDGVSEIEKTVSPRKPAKRPVRQDD